MKEARYFEQSFCIHLSCFFLEIVHNCKYFSQFHPLLLLFLDIFHFGLTISGCFILYVKDSYSPVPNCRGLQGVEGGWKNLQLGTGEYSQNHSKCSSYRALFLFLLGGNPLKIKSFDMFWKSRCWKKPFFLVFLHVTYYDWCVEQNFWYWAELLQNSKILIRCRYIENVLCFNHKKSNMIVFYPKTHVRYLDNGWCFWVLKNVLSSKYQIKQHTRKWEKTTHISTKARPI